MHTIRPAKTEDFDSLQQLFRETMTRADWVSERVKQGLNFAAVSERESIFVCETANQAVVGLISVWTPHSFIHHLYVDAEHRDQGIGKALLNSLETWLPRPWQLKCTVANTKAQSFYERLGWQQIDRGRGPQGEYFLLQLN